MGMKTVVISSSLRKNSNSEALADEFIKGAEGSLPHGKKNQSGGHMDLEKAYETGKNV